ncbi:MAG: hypothetical protein E7349_01560 [Clostridiales bacterium]|nr:hypothetical protein [Clostridiales bacterium]
MLINRAIHVDFHTMPNIYDFGERYRAEEFAARLSNAHVSYINLVASCNLGFCYFPTDIGVRYPYMKGDRFGETLRACHQKGIGVSAYINVGLNHENAYLHPDWCRVNKKGQRIYGDTTGNFFRMMCYNAKGFRAYLLRLVKEVVQRYDVDGFFFDGLKIEPCYCPKCKADMLAKGIRLTEKNAREFTHKNLLSLCCEIKEIIGKKDVFFCGLPFTDGLSEHYEVECLPSGIWGYDYFHQAAAYARNFYDNPVYMTGRFQADWGDFGGIKTKESFQYDLYDALANGCRICFGDHLHPSDNLIEKLYEQVGQVYDECKRYEKYTLPAKYVAEIGVLNDGDIFSLSEHRFIGTVRILNELKYTYNLITVDSDFSRYALIILPDACLVDKALERKLSDYVQNGGKLLSSGVSGLDISKRKFALVAYDFAQFCGIDRENYPYFTFAKGEDKKTKWAEYHSGILMKARKGDVYANYIQPYNKRYYDGRHGYFYTPPERETEYVSALRSGNIAHISFSVFSAYAEHFLAAHRKLVGQLLQTLIKSPLIKGEDLPLTSRVTVTETERYRLLHIRVDYPEIKNGKGVIEEHIHQKCGRQVCVEGEYTHVFEADSEKEVKISIEDGYTRIELPEICGYKLLVCYK